MDRRISTHQAVVRSWNGELVTLELAWLIKSKSVYTMITYSEEFASHNCASLTMQHEAEHAPELQYVTRSMNFLMQLQRSAKQNFVVLFIPRLTHSVRPSVIAEFYMRQAVKLAIIDLSIKLTTQDKSMLKHVKVSHTQVTIMHQYDTQQIVLSKSLTDCQCSMLHCDTDWNAIKWINQQAKWLAWEHPPLNFVCSSDYT